MAQDEGSFDSEVFKGARALSNAEVSKMLFDYMNHREQQVSHYQAPTLVHKTKVYVDRFSQGKNDTSSQEIRKVLMDHGLKEHEQAMVANLAPETVEEAEVLVPSLKDDTRFTEESLEQMMRDVAMYRTYE